MEDGVMIVRSWRGRAPSAKPDAYPAHFAHNVLPALREIQGETIEFLLLVRRTSLEAIRTLAGEDLGKAVVEPEAVAALTSLDPRARHYEVVQEAAAG